MVRSLDGFYWGTLDKSLLLITQIITSCDKYSEDIDLVQIKSEPINPVLKRIREKLSFLGTKRIGKQHSSAITCTENRYERRKLRFCRFYYLLIQELFVKQ